MSRLSQTYRELGFVVGTCYLVNRLLAHIGVERLFYCYAIVAQPVVPRRMRPAKRYSVRLADRLEQLAGVHQEFGIAESVIRDRFDQNTICILLLRDERPVACAWTALNGYFEDEVRCHFQPLPLESTAWDFDVQVLPRFRGSLTFARLWDEVNAYYAEQRRAWTFSRISRFNVGSIDSHRSMGAITIGNMLFVVLGRVQVMFSRISPRLHLSLSDSSIPRLSLDLDMVEGSADRS